MRVKVIVDRRVILHHIVAKRAVAHGCDFFFPSFPTTPDCMVVIHAMEYSSTRPYNPIIGVLPYPSAVFVGMRFPVLGYLNTLTKYSAHTLYRVDNFMAYICSSVCSLRCAEIALCPMPWLCFCNSTCHALNDLMKKPALASEMWDSRYPLWLPLPRSGRLWRTMLWLSR